MRKTYQIIEYGSFTRAKEVAGYTSLSAETFDALENFVLSNSRKETDVLELMHVSARKGIGKIITAKNYVGVITMKDGTSIEILPKVYSYKGSNIKETKQLLVDMLRTLRNLPYKFRQRANVNIERMNIFEVFIRMFLDEVFSIVKKGLRCDYETIQANETMFKGRMKFAEQIKHNYAHKERSYVEFDEFNTNRVENKLLKATLLYLYRITTSSKNKNDIKSLLNRFLEVDMSEDYEKDFNRIVSERNSRDYNTALTWCRVFLMGKSFTSFSGTEVAFALLFPMEILFERYIAMQLKKTLKGTEYAVLTQDCTYHLFDEPKKFLLKPDIVVKRKSDNGIFVMDTKWKILSDIKPNYGISQADMYQMYAYQKKYNSENVTLLYPFTEKVPYNKEITYYSLDGVSVDVKFIDLFNVKNSIETIMSDLLMPVAPVDVKCSNITNVK